MRCDAVAIEELVMRVPGVARDAAPALVEDVLRRVQANLRGSGRTGRVHLAEVKVEVRPGSSRDQLVEQIAASLTEALR